MQICVTLESSAGEIAREIVEIPQAKIDRDESEAVSLAAGEVIDGWVLSVGDVIRIVEVQS
jgi:hypothetical protein